MKKKSCQRKFSTPEFNNVVYVEFIIHKNGDVTISDLIEPVLSIAFALDPMEERAHKIKKMPFRFLCG